MPTGIWGNKLQPFNDSLSLNAAVTHPDSVTVLNRPPVSTEPPAKFSGIGQGGSLEAGPLTPDLIHRLYPGSYPTGVFTMPADSVWRKLNFDRPTVLLAILPPSAGFEPAFFYNYGIPGVAVSGSANTTLANLATQKSERNVAFLSNPGDWWLRNATPAVGTYYLYAYDASNPGVLARFLTRPGSNYGIQNNALVTLTTEVSVLPANPGRTALTVQCTGSGTIHVFVGDAGYLNSSTGWRLPTNASITFTGDTVLRGSLRVCAENSTPSVIEWIEYAMW